jgi:hypothetical protein
VERKPQSRLAPRPCLEQHLPLEPRRGGIAPIQVVMNRYLRHSGLASKLRNVAIFKAWRDALGIQLATRARPVRFENGELEVTVRSAALLQELSNFTGEQYRTHANLRLGSERIQRVVFRLER